jgi:hypothetical protein
MVNNKQSRDIWEHELKTVKTLQRYGHTVFFLPENKLTKSADILLDGKVFEIKSPTSNKLSAVERNLKKASHQAANIILDARRMKGVRDDNIQRFLAVKLKTQKSIKKLLFINKKDQLIDIDDLL